MMESSGQHVNSGGKDLWEKLGTRDGITASPPLGHTDHVNQSLDKEEPSLSSSNDQFDGRYSTRDEMIRSTPHWHFGKRTWAITSPARVSNAVSETNKLNELQPITAEAEF